MKQLSLKDVYVASILKYYLKRSQNRLDCYIQRLSLRFKHLVLEQLKNKNQQWDFKTKIRCFAEVYLNSPNVNNGADIEHIDALFILPKDSSDYISCKLFSDLLL
ncbi:uncharacterized protein VNE69_08058 [Vairimorpha necatrix]|uniref:Uncharacterized protein n=1 Tax=Vairimorpha necatrix TaxID=6039 RepID=A0AAX4JE99_9MICR